MTKKPTQTPISTRKLRTKPVPAVQTKTSKQNMVLAMLRRANGASIAEIVEATNWQAHSVRGFFAGALKKRLGIEVISQRGTDGVRRYHVAALRS